MKHIENFIIERLRLNNDSKFNKHKFHEIKKVIYERNSKWGKPIEENNKLNFEPNHVYYFNPGGVFFPKYGFIYILSLIEERDYNYKVFNALLITEGVKDKEKIAINYCQYDSDGTTKEIYLNIGNTDQNKEWPTNEFKIVLDNKFYDEFINMVNQLYHDNDHQYINEYNIINKFNKLCIDKEIIEVTDFNDELRPKKTK